MISFFQTKIVTLVSVYLPAPSLCKSLRKLWVNPELWRHITFWFKMNYFFRKTINMSVSVNLELWIMNFECWVIFWTEIAIDPNRNFFRKSNNTSIFCLSLLCKIWKSLVWILKKLKIWKVLPTPIAKHLIFNTSGPNI